MEDKIKKDIIKIIDSALISLKDKDSMNLGEISNNTIHNASIFQDQNSITIAVIMYALSKIINRMSKIEPNIINQLTSARDALQNDHFQRYEQMIKTIIDTISSFDEKLDLYIQKVINEAEIKKGSKLYEHGISLARTADLLGITQWELMKYVGHTKIADNFNDGIDVKDRLNYTRKLFNL
jgi:hypothetical protein